MHLFGATSDARHSLHSRGRPNGGSAPRLLSIQHSVPRPSPPVSHFRPIRRLSNRGPFELVRAAAPGDLGPGCYVLKAAKTPSGMTRAQLRREALVANQVNHCNLIPVLNAECDAPVPRLVLPYLEGISLRRLLDSSQQLAVSYSLCVIRQVAAALGAIHAAGWLHGQVRPEHVIISPQGHTTLIDLTQARRLESSECDATALLPVSPAYAAPETASSHGRLIPAADAYSLGIVLYESLTSQPPFQNASPRELMHSHLRDAPPDLRALRADVSLEVAELCRRLLAKEPLRRPAISQVMRWLAELEIVELAA
jgi:eukaryotic-like serine/threonine-protein kinase